jgi:hypothetical protein
MSVLESKEDFLLAELQPVHQMLEGCSAGDVIHQQYHVSTEHVLVQHAP